jgi:intracellular sulfur oxidation DsrE/DsrF family protein
MTSRRRFLGLAGAGAAALGAGLVPAAAAQPPSDTPRPQSKWDLRWIDELGGRHRQVFDLGTPDLHAVANYLRAFREVYGLAHPDVVAVVGIASYAFPVNATDALWEKYELGLRWRVRDPATGKPARRNIFLAEAPADAPVHVREASLPQLTGRGVRFWQCDNGLQGVANRLARETKGDAVEIEAEIRENLHPWVHLVPAHVMLVGLLQERGFAYEHLM